jgi:hypothetical protein
LHASTNTCREYALSASAGHRRDVGAVTHVFSHINHHYCVEWAKLPADAAGTGAGAGAAAERVGHTLHENRAWQWVRAGDLAVWVDNARRAVVHEEVEIG